MWAREQELVWQQARERADAVLKDAARAVARLSDEAVAELFGLDPELVAALRPRSGRWSAAYVEELLRTRPAWLHGADAARAEVARRAQSAERRASARTARRLGWRRVWAHVFGMAVEDVPETVGRPTQAAVRAALASPRVGPARRTAERRCSPRPASACSRAGRGGSTRGRSGSRRRRGGVGERQLDPADQAGRSAGSAANPAK